MKPARIAVICIAAVAAIGLALVVRAMGSSSGEPVAVAAAARRTRAPDGQGPGRRARSGPRPRLTDADLDWKDWPADEVNPAFITDGSVPVPRPTAAAAEGDAAEAEDEAKPAGAVAARHPRRRPTGHRRRQGRLFRLGRARTDPGRRADRRPQDRPRRRQRLYGRLSRARHARHGHRASRSRPPPAASSCPATGSTSSLTRQTWNCGTERRRQPAPSSPADRAAERQGPGHRPVDPRRRRRAGRGRRDRHPGGRPADAETLALAKAAGDLSLALRSYADTAGPSGRVGPPRAGAQRPPPSASSAADEPRSGECPMKRVR